MTGASFRPLLRQMLPLLLMGGLAACANLGPGPKPSAGTGIEAPQLPPLAIRDHKRIIDAFGGEVDLPALTRLANDVFTRLAPVSDRPELRYRLTVLNSATINAFALPSGHIYVTRGMLALVNDTSELAAVLGHEMAHVYANHALMREEQAKTDEIVAALRQRVLNDPAGAEQRRANGKLTLASFSRAQELEADLKGIALIAKAGFDPRGAARVLKALDAYNRMKGTPTPQGFLASHPSTPERIEQAVIAARQFSAPDMGEREKGQLLTTLDGLMFGDDPRNGLIVGRTFSHPTLGFTLNVPAGFTLENNRQAVIGAGPNDSGFRFDAANVPKDQKLADYLRSGWIDGLVPQSVADITINGLPAVTGISRGPEWSFRVYVIRVGNETYRAIYAAKQLDAAMDEQFQLSMGSFRALSAQEAQSLQPARLRIITLAHGDSLDNHALRLQRVEHPAETLRIINGLFERPANGGDVVKIIKE